LRFNIKKLHLLLLARYFIENIDLISSEPTALAEVIKFHRKKAVLSLLELARVAGVRKTVVFDVEKDKTSGRFVSL